MTSQEVDVRKPKRKVATTKMVAVVAGISFILGKIISLPVVDWIL